MKNQNKIDLQVNGAFGYLFNNVKTIEEFLQIELINIKKASTIIVPTFITDSDLKLKNFLKIVKNRINLENEDLCFIEKNKKYKVIKYKNIKKNDKILSDIFRINLLPAIHLEGPFITNKGTHKEKFLRKINKETLNNFYKNFEKFERKINIILTIAPELFLDINIKIWKDFLNLMSKKNIEIKLFAGHTNVLNDEFIKVQNLLGDDKFIAITHYHNAMFEGHFNSNIEGIPSNCIKNNCIDYVGLITDGQHTNQGELLPTLINLYDKIYLVSDSARPSCCKIKNNKLYEMAGIPSILIKEINKTPMFCWVNFERNNDIFNSLLEYIREKNIKTEKEILKKLVEIYKKAGSIDNIKIGYKNLAGSAVNLLDCYNFLIDLRDNESLIIDELWKTYNNKKANIYLIEGLKKLKVSIDYDLYKKEYLENNERILAVKTIQNLLKNKILSDENLKEMLYNRQLKILDLNDNFNLNSIKKSNFNKILKENKSDIKDKNIENFLNKVAKKVYKNL